ncbi:MAG: hypothetical protein JXA87_13350, partial [Thermoleophilia bacterium]|nr:hypothetical protein [Thermoleophilia bacterium]
MTLVRRIGAGYGGILLLVIAMVVVAMVVLGPLRTSIKSYSDTALAEAEAASQIALTTASMGTDAVVGVVGGTAEDRAEAVARLEVDKAAAVEALAVAAAFEQADSENMAAIENLRTLLDGYGQRIEAALAVAEVQSDLALARLTQEVVPLGKQLDAAAAVYSEQKQVEAGSAADGLGDKVNRLWLVMIIMAAVVIVGGVALAIAIPRAISKHLRTAVSGIDRSASEMLAVASQVAASAAQTAAATNETTATVEEVK